MSYFDKELIHDCTSQFTTESCSITFKLSQFEAIINSWTSIGSIKKPKTKIEKEQIRTFFRRTKNTFFYIPRRSEIIINSTNSACLINLRKNLFPAESVKFNKEHS